MKILELAETKEGWFPKKLETYTGRKLCIYVDQLKGHVELFRVPLFSRNGDIRHIFRCYVQEENDV